MTNSKSKIPFGYVGFIQDIATREITHRIWDGENWHIAYGKDGFYTPEARKIIDELSGEKPVTKPFDPTKPVQTRDGRKARILCTDAKNSRSIVALVTNSDGEERVFTYDNRGRVRWNDDEYDLINIPERTSQWVNVCVYNKLGFAILCHSTKEEAVKEAPSICAGLVEIIFEDGKPVDVKLHKDEKR